MSAHAGLFGAAKTITKRINMAILEHIHYEPVWHRPSASKDNALEWFKLEGGKSILLTLVGCFTGARSETIRTLRTSLSETAIDEPLSNGLMKRIPVGPGTGIKTKFDVELC